MLSGEIAFKNNHYYYCYFWPISQTDVNCNLVRPLALSHAISLLELKRDGMWK